MKLLIEDNQPAGFVSDTHPGFTVRGASDLPPEKHTPEILANLIERDHGAKEAAKFRVKVTVERRIKALQWRIDRAVERDHIGVAGESVDDVYREREMLRRAGNRSDEYINGLEDLTEIRNHQLTVLPSDTPDDTVVSTLEFMRRFTPQERKNMRAIRDKGSAEQATQSQELQDFWELLQLASSVNINDPDTQGGVMMMEAAGLLAAGRANEILAVE